jgi:hypothetical protein
LIKQSSNANVYFKIQVKKQPVCCRARIIGHPRFYIHARAQAVKYIVLVHGAFVLAFPIIDLSGIFVLLNYLNNNK